MSNRIDEIFILIGIHNQTYYFMHTIADPSYDESISYQIYNNLIHHKIITNPSYDVIIYDLLMTKINIIKIVHSMNQQTNSSFDPNIFYELANAKYKSNNPDQLIIKYSYEKNCYLLYKIETLDINNLFDISNTISNPIKINKISSVLCLKPFN